MAEYKKNHVVPQMILKNFINSDGEYFYYNSKNPKGIVEVRKPENTFFRNDIYVSKDLNGKRNVTLETEHYGALESVAAPIFDKLQNSLKCLKVPVLEASELEIVQTFIANQMIRSPESISSINTDDLLSETLKKVEKRYGRSERIDVEKDSNRVIQSAKCDALQSPISLKQTLAAIKSKGLYIAKTEEQSCQFLIGSNPCVKFQFKGDNLGSPLTELFCPFLMML